MNSEEHEEDQSTLLFKALTALRRPEVLYQRLSYLRCERPIAKRRIDQQIEKNKGLTTDNKATVQKQYKKNV